MCLKCVTEHLDTFVSDIVLSKIDGSKLLLERDTLTQSLHQLVIEVLVASEVEGLNLFKFVKLSKYSAHSWNVNDLVVFECHLDEVASLL